MTEKTINIPERKRESWKIFDEIAPTYDRINRIISMGVDTSWRRNFRRFLQNRDNLSCLDLATGTGDVALELAEDERVNRVLGTDMSKGMIEYGQKRIARSKFADKINLEIGDGVSIPGKDSSVDVITVAFGIRNFSDHKESLKNMVRVLKPRGRAMILEFSLPTNKLFKVLYLFYFRSILPRIGNLLSKHSYAYTYLNKTVESFPYGEAFMKDMKDAGFKQVQLTLGIATFYIGYK
jgi:demethylmenaquinone methyltransferase/2-methoxy-6-polyprenyl-1,4-benzoquinol methylase